MSDIHFLDIHPQGDASVLFLHGLGADATSWGLQFPALTASGFRSIAVDAPGFGRSPYGGRGWSVRSVAAQMADLVSELKLGPVHVVGLSMGGVLAQQFALDFPTLTNKLVLVSTFSVLRPETISGWLYFAQRFLLVQTLGLDAQAPVVARRVFPAPQDEEMRRELIRRITQADIRAYRAAMRALGLYDSRARLPEIKAPTLVVTGACDTTVSPERQKLLSDAIPGARQVIIPQAGHAVNVEKFEEFNQILLAFLQA